MTDTIERSPGHPRERTGNVLLAASAGGHLDLLLAVAPDVVDGQDPVWVTSRTSRGNALRDSVANVALVPEYGRTPVAALRNLVSAARIVRRFRPSVVITAGAGVVVPLCLLARLAGARIIFVETMARVSSPSRTARLLARIASRTIVQWPELRSELPGAVVCRPLLLESIPPGARPEGTGTLVAVGTHDQPFTRLIEMVERAAAGGVLPEPVLVQTGPARTASDRVQAVPFLTGSELQSRLGESEIVVCHGGAGIISSALAAGRRPIVVPRRARLSEHIDDHQYQLSRKLADWGLVVLVENEITAADVRGALEPMVLPEELRSGPTIASALREDLAAASVSGR